MQETIKQLIEWGNRANPPNPGFHRRAASMQKALDRMVKIKRPILERRAMDLTLKQEDRSGKQVIVLDRVSKAFGDRELLRGTSALLLYGERVALMGGNGAGKSTLMKMIIGEIPHDEGEIRLGSRVDIGYLAQEESPPAEDSTVLRYFCDALAMEEGGAGRTGPLPVLRLRRVQAGIPAVRRRMEPAAPGAADVPEAESAASRRADQPFGHRLAGGAGGSLDSFPARCSSSPMTAIS